MEIRTLEPHEREAVLELLDHWEMADGWRGRDFFRRYVELDPSYRDENFWVAAEGGRLHACVQIFPRALRVPGGTVSLGGIGSVFTHPERRSGGLATAVLRRAEQAMRERGMALGMLFTGRISFYERLGWIAWPGASALYLRDAGREAPSPAPDPDVRVEAFRAERDLGDVAALHAAYSGERPGTALRDAEAWRASLRMAGNPDEDFRVVRRVGRVVGYARFIALEGHPILAEFGRAADDPEPLAAALAAAFAERGGAYGPAPADPALEEALGRRGIRVQPLPDRNLMLRCLDAKALVAAAGAELLPGEDDADLLGRVLPPERTLFWPADRF